MQTTEDTIPEQAEAFTVRLSNQSGASLARTTATGTIDDDDVRGEVTISDDTVEEGEVAVFTISLSSGGSQSVTVDYATENGTAVSTSDYSTMSGTWTLSPGGSHMIMVPTTEDTTPEPTEAFNVTLTDNADSSLLASATGAALLRRRLFRLFIGVFARGRSLFGSFQFTVVLDPLPVKAEFVCAGPTVFPRAFRVQRPGTAPTPASFGRRSPA